jgi:Na+/proline symporter
MSWLDWWIVIIPMGLLIWLAIYSGKFARGIVDFLAAGRIAGRYVL